MGRPAKEDARDTRREVLDAALELFAQHGYAGSSMRQIAQAVGVRESALYHHFPSKDAIMEALVIEFGPARARTVTQVDLDLELRKGLQAWLRKLAHQVVDSWASPREQKYMRVMFAEGPRLAESAINPRAMVEEALGFLAQMFSELIRRKLVRPEEPEVLARAFMGPMLTLRIQYLMLSAPSAAQLTKLRKRVDLHVDFFTRAVTT